MTTTEVYAQLRYRFISLTVTQFINDPYRTNRNIIFLLYSTRNNSSVIYYNGCVFFVFFSPSGKFAKEAAQNSYENCLLASHRICFHTLFANSTINVRASFQIYFSDDFIGGAERKTTYELLNLSGVVTFAGNIYIVRKIHREIPQVWFRTKRHLTRNLEPSLYRYTRIVNL